MANETTNPAMSSRRIFFGENEAAALKFADDHWQRVICVGYVTESVKEGEPAGWVISYAQKDSEVLLHPLSDSFDSSVSQVKTARKTRSSGV